MTAETPPPYFVTGLPRSRTAWLSILLSTPDAICKHEEILNWSTVPQYLHGMECQAGDSSSILLYHWRAVVGRFPTSKWLVVKRDPQEALEAAVATCQDMETYIRREWVILVKNLEEMEKELDLHKRMIVSVKSLDDYFTCRAIVGFLTGRELSAEWHAHCMRLKVTVKQYHAEDWAWMQDVNRVPQRIEPPVPAGDGQVRLWTDADLPMMNQWCLEHLGHEVTAARIPPLGVVVNDWEGKPAAMLFAQLAVDRPVAYLEDPISRPGMTMARTLEAMRFGLDALRASLLAIGYDALIANTSKPFARVLRHWGWTQREDGLIKLETSTA